MAKTEFDYYYGAESEQFSFVRVPRVLFTDKEYFGSLSNDARILYGFLLERMGLSRKNEWIDDENRVYIIFSIEEIEETMGVCHEKALNILKELDDDKGIGLVKKKRRGLGLPSILYVKNFIINDDESSKTEAQDNTFEAEKKFENIASYSPNTKIELSEVGETDFLKSENQTSANRKNQLQEVRKSDSNYIDINYIEKSYIDDQSINQSGGSLQNFSPGNVPSVENSDGLIEGISRNAVEESVKKQIDYDCFMSNPYESVVSMVDEVKDLMVDVLCGERIVIADGKRVS